MSVCDLPLMNTVCDTITSGVGSTVTDSIGAWIAKSTGELAAAAADLAAKAVDSTTAVDLNASWFRDNYELLLPIGLLLTVGTFCLGLARAAWRRDSESMFEALKGTVIGVFFAFSAIALTTVALTVVDALSAGLFSAAHSSVSDAVRRLVMVSQYGQLHELGWLVQAIVALGAGVGAFLYWGVMVFRKVGILILVTLAVFAGAGGGWEATRRWQRGWAVATATLIVSKLLMTIVFLVGISAMGKSKADDGLSALSDAMAGIVVLALVLLCPYATYKFAHWATDGMGEDLHRTGSVGLATAAGAAKTAGSLAMRAGTGTPAPQGPATVPGMGADGVASGIDPTGGSSGSGTSPKQTTFRYGEDPGAPGDKGSPLIKRPPTDGDQGQPLIRNTGQQTAADAPASSGSATAEAPTGPQPQGAATGSEAATPVRPEIPYAGSAPAGGGPSPQGSATPQRWTYPDPPPGGPRS